jgi:beta-galactosidase
MSNMNMDRRRFLWASSAIALAGASPALGLGGSRHWSRSILSQAAAQVPRPAAVAGSGLALPPGRPAVAQDQGPWLVLRQRQGRQRRRRRLARYDDSDWRELDLPHDWAVEGPFDRDENLSQGYRPRGKSAGIAALCGSIPAIAASTFPSSSDAIATNATIWFNGSVVAHNWSGYNALQIDSRPFARYGDELNSIAVRSTPIRWKAGGMKAPASIATSG